MQCLSVKLKLTLTDSLLQKSLRDAVVEPFLGAYNKRAAVPLSTQELLRVEVDGAVCDPSTMAGKLLTVDAPTVVLHAPAVDAQGLADALTALTDEAMEEEALVTLRALRRASHDEAAREAVLAPRVVARAVEYAALSAAAPRAWSDSGTSAEATVPPHNRTDASPGLAPSLTVSLRLIPTLIRCCCTTCWSSTGRAWAARCARRPSTCCRSSSPRSRPRRSSTRRGNPNLTLTLTLTLTLPSPSPSPSP